MCCKTSLLLNPVSSFQMTRVENNAARCIKQQEIEKEKEIKSKKGWFR